jgi:hypothetical protein
MTPSAVDLGHEVGVELLSLIHALWGGAEGLGVSLEAPPPGRVAVETYAIVPTLRRARMLLPVDRAGAVAALRAGADLRGPAQRRRRAAAAIAIAAGGSGLVGRHRLIVHADPGTGRGPSLTEVIATALGRSVVLGVNVRPPSPYRTPVAQVVGDGRVLAYAKIACTRATSRTVAAEARALRAVNGSERLRAPSIVAETEWQGAPVLLTSPMPAGLRRLDARGDGPEPHVMREVFELFGTSTAPYGRGEVGARLRRRAAEVGEGAEPAALEELLVALDGRGDVILQAGAWHGDWSPWNLARQGTHVWAWDWEFAASDVPLGLDAVHFAFQRAFVMERRGLVASFDRARVAAVPVLESLGVLGAAAELTLAIHRAELALRFLEARAEGAEPNPRFHAEGPQALGTAADRVRAL